MTTTNVELLAELRELLESTKPGAFRDKRWTDAELLEFGAELVRITEQSTMAAAVRVARGWRASHRELAEQKVSETIAKNAASERADARRWKESN